MRPSVRAQLAFRERAGLIGALTSCVCGFPLVKYPTETQHEEVCPAHAVLMFYAQHAENVKELEALPPAMGPDLLRGYAARWNELADAAFELAQSMRHDDITAMSVEDAVVVSNRARAIAFQLEAQAHVLEDK